MARMVSAWSEAFEIGITVIDMQNKELFRLLRDLEQMVLTQCAQYTYTNFVHLICEIREYATYHFYEEEKIMETLEYEALEEHKALHKQFEEHIGSINYIQLEKNPLPIIDELRSFIELWIMQHILLEDMKLTPIVKAKGLVG